MKLPKELREKKDLGKHSKDKKCSISECTETAIRSLSENKWSAYLEKAGLKIQENKQHKIFLCKKHYNQGNKVRKSEEKLTQKKGFLNDSRSSKQGKNFDM